MVYTIKRTSKEIDDLLDRAGEGINSGTKFRGMSYEEGIREMFSWLTEDSPDCNPMDG